MTRTERNLKAAGYRYAGSRTDKSEAAAVATEHRAQGGLARVIKTTSPGRVHSSDLFEIYVK